MRKRMFLDEFKTANDTSYIASSVKIVRAAFGLTNGKTKLEITAKFVGPTPQYKVYTAHSVDKYNIVKQVKAVTGSVDVSSLVGNFVKVVTTETGEITSINEADNLFKITI